MDQLCAKPSPELQHYHYILRFDSCLEAVVPVRLSDISCFCFLSSETTKKCKFAYVCFFFFLKFPRIWCRVQAFRILKNVLQYHFSHTGLYYKRFLSPPLRHIGTVSYLTVAQSELSKILLPLWPHRSHTSSIERWLRAGWCQNVLLYHSLINYAFYQFIFHQDVNLTSQTWVCSRKKNTAFLAALLRIPLASQTRLGFFEKQMMNFGNSDLKMWDGVCTLSV